MHKIIAQKILYALFVNFARYCGFSMGTDIRDLNSDSYDQKTLKDIGLKMCTKQYIRYNIYTCRSYHYDRDNFVCSLNKDYNPNSTFDNLWNGERSTIQDTFSSPCFSVSCQRKERCVILRGGEPKCVIFECDDPPNVNHAAVDQGVNTVKSNRTYTCSTGYSLSGDAILFCKANGLWTTPTFSCQQITCGTPTVITGVIYTGTGEVYGSTRTMSCDTGYTASGPTTLTCEFSGQWSTPITCSQCPDPPTVSGAIVTGSGKSPQSTRTYTCDAGYESSSSAQTITCGSNFQWSTLTLTCTACSSFAYTYTQKTNKFFNPPVSFTPAVSGGSVDAAYCKSFCTSRSDFVCVAAYYRKNPSGYCVMRPMRVYDDPSYPNYYTTDNTYDEYIRDCQIQCDEPTPVAGAIYTGSGNSPGNTRTMSCDAGYAMSGSTTLTCQSNGQWTTAITCTKCTGSSLSSSYTLKSNMYFNPPVSFTPSISGSSVNAASCQNFCTQRNDFICVAAYYRKSTGGYCVMRQMRVYDDPSYPQYYNSDNSWDEYIRNCV